ncbi:MAG: N-acetyl-gamma-glutamyl-phosphate reductase [Alphaproteobacteria bacterium]
MAKETYKVFIDGQHGTTGLQIKERLANHNWINVIEIEPSERKNLERRKELIAESDLTFLCLPDDAAKEIFAAVRHLDTKIIDASTAHRCDDAWVYGLPELNATQCEKIKNAQFVANPGCYATASTVLLHPLIDQGILDAQQHVQLHGYSGYSGGGNGMIDKYEAQDYPSAFSLYGLNFNHKHIPEIMKFSGLKQTPTFLPAVVKCRQGMVVLTSLNQAELKKDISEIQSVMKKAYQGKKFVKLIEQDIKENPFFDINGLENTNNLEICVFVSPNNQNVVLAARLDNLGKGASGAAVQNMNIMLGLDEELGVHN